MGKLRFGKVLDCLCLSSGPSSCFCINSLDNFEDDDFEKKPLVSNDGAQLVRLKDVLAGQVVVLRVSMHCNGCAKQVEKRISKIEGVTSYEVDLETQMVVVTGDILPYEVLECVSKVKNAQIWTEDSQSGEDNP